MNRRFHRRRAIKLFMVALFTFHKVLKIYINHSSFATSARASLAFVVSQCQEPLATVELINKISLELHRYYETSVIFVCKCGMRYHCSYSLPNVGRDTHTFVNHIVQTYSELHDITVFLNGGFMAKHHTLLALKRISWALKRNVFSGEQARQIYIDRDVLSTVFYEKNFAGQSRTTCAHTVSEYCDFQSMEVTLRSKQGKRRCTQTFPCVSGQECPCDVQVNCSWQGSSSQNWGQMNPTLDPTSPSSGVHGESFYAWACSRLNLIPNMLHECGASWGSVFAVGADRINALPIMLYSNLHNEYKLYGANGGIMGHYMERSFRALFFCLHQ